MAGSTSPAIFLRRTTVPDYTPSVTPIEYLQAQRLYLKRDDLYEFAGVRGGKVRSCRRLSQGAQMLITASSRHSPQMCIVARIAKRLQIPARCHMPQGVYTEEMQEAMKAGATLIQHRAGYNTVIIKRAKDDIKNNFPQATEIPFGMRCVEAVEETAKQVRNLPAAGQINRIVVPVGSGISLAGVLLGISTYRTDLKKVRVLGVQVGANPVKTLDQLAIFGWRNCCEIVEASQPYHAAVKQSQIAHVAVDPHYEGKVLGLLEPNDVFWLVGIRRSSATEALTRQ
jgi:1-aminocyclopropane-1-carboxylate deaminase/D-cysteine desulfhydrase-like pyridoxal-dependent ACC family enzyme